MKKDLRKCGAKLLYPPLLSPRLENEGYDDLEDQGMKIIMPSNIIDKKTRLEGLPGSKLPSHTDILIEAGNLINEIHKKGEIQNEQHYRNAPDKFHTK